MKTLFKKTLVASLLGAFASSAFANDTTGAIRGVVSAGDGLVPNAKVVLVDTRTGAKKEMTTNSAGSFASLGLTVGGPYTLTVTDPNTGKTETKSVMVGLGVTTQVPVSLQAAVETIVVTGSQLSATEFGGTGPSKTFTLTDLTELPSVNRDLKDALRVDPRVHIDTTNGNAVQCGGANPRFNSLTVDGVRMNDNFGLNSNGYPTTRMPFSYDAISQVSVEFAPFDVKYGGFTACNFNAVTKSGKDHIDGGFFYDFTSDSLKGDSLRGRSVYVAPFTERRYGVHVGAPIVAEKLYVFVAAERLEGADTFNRGAYGTGAATEVLGLLPEDLARIIQVAKTRYGYDAGAVPTSIPVSDEKLLVKLDWYLSDNHRAAFTYNFNDGFSIRMADSGNDQFELDKHMYKGGASFNSYVVQLNSDWTDALSSEFRIGYAELQNQADPLGGIDIGEVRIGTANTIGTTRNTASVYLGPDDSRHDNVLNYNTTFVKAAGQYLYGDHVITAGVEQERYDIYNLFGQKSQGEFRFASVDDFELGIPSNVYYYNAAGTNNTEDLAAEFGYAITTLYAQDEWMVPDTDVTLTYGVRYDRYSSHDKPQENPFFVTRYGVSNSTNVDGKGLLQPRLGVNWAYSPEVEFRAGVGLYSGGNPNVWLSNNFQNNGVIQYNYELDNRVSRRSLFAMPHDGTGRPLYDIPEEAIQAVINGTSNSDVNALDPNFKIPREWKVALGATVELPGEFYWVTDALFTKKKESATLVDLNRIDSGRRAPDGRVIYTHQHLNSRGQPFKDLLLTNVKGQDGTARTLSTSLSKSYDDYGIDWSLAYAYTRSEDVNSMSSSVANSNYTGMAISDTESPGVSVSNYDIPHRFTFTVGYKTEWVSGYPTSVKLFTSRHQGKPYSFVFNNTFRSNGAVDKYANTMFYTRDQDQARHLMYVPTGPDDSRVSFAPGFDTAAFFQYLADTGLDRYAGGIAPRNAIEGSWVTKMDLRIEQDLPAFAEGHASSAYLVVENLTNLLNDEWGVQKEASFPHMIRPVEVGEIRNGQYVFSKFNATEPERDVAQQSLWSIRLGVKYTF